MLFQQSIIWLQMHNIKQSVFILIFYTSDEQQNFNERLHVNVKKKKKMSSVFRTGTDTCSLVQIMDTTAKPPCWSVNSQWCLVSIVFIVKCIFFSKCIYFLMLSFNIIWIFSFHIHVFLFVFLPCSWCWAPVTQGLPHIPHQYSYFMSSQYRMNKQLYKSM